MNKVRDLVETKLNSLNKVATELTSLDKKSEARPPLVFANDKSYVQQKSWLIHYGINDLVINNLRVLIIKDEKRISRQGNIFYYIPAWIGLSRYAPDYYLFVEGNKIVGAIPSKVYLDFYNRKEGKIHFGRIPAGELISIDEFYKCLQKSTKKKVGTRRTKLKSLASKEVLNNEVGTMLAKRYSIDELTLEQLIPLMDDQVLTEEIFKKQ